MDDDHVEVRHLDGLRAISEGGDSPKLTGRAIVTGVATDLGAYREIVAPEALRNALAAAPDLPMLFDHSPSRVLGRRSAKTLHVEQDAEGLRFEVIPPSHEAGLVESVGRGDIRGASFAFSHAKDSWDDSTTPATRTLHSFKLHEISVVTFPAFPTTTVALRSLAHFKQSKEPVMETVTPPVVPVVDLVPPIPVETRDVEIVGEERVLRPADSYRSWMERDGHADPTYKALRPGAFIRALVLGPRNDLERRALAEGTDSAGGFTVPDIVSAAFIDKLRAAMVTQRAGARTVPLTSDKTTIARLATDPTVAWRLENAEVTDNSPTFEGVVFVPRSLASLVRVSRELLEDSLNIETALENAFAQALAVELDRVALIGTGTPPEPKGISATTNVGSVAGGGALASWDKVLDAVYEVLVDNGPMPTAIVMPPRTFIAMAKLKMATELAPLPRPPLISDMTVYTTTALPIDEAPGTASRIILGDFTQLLIGVRSAIRIEVLRERYGEFLQYGFLAHLRADIAVEHPEAFAMVTGILP